MDYSKASGTWISKEDSERFSEMLNEQNYKYETIDGLVNVHFTIECSQEIMVGMVAQL